MSNHLICRFSFHLQVGEREYSLYLKSLDTTPDFKHKDNKVTIYAPFLEVDEEISDKDWKEAFTFNKGTVEFKRKLADGIGTRVLYKLTEGIRFTTRFSAKQADSDE